VATTHDETDATTNTPRCSRPLYHCLPPPPWHLPASDASKEAEERAANLTIECTDLAAWW
jgi:hypothetical protein